MSQDINYFDLKHLTAKKSLSESKALLSAPPDLKVLKSIKVEGSKPCSRAEAPPHSVFITHAYIILPENSKK